MCRRKGDKHCGNAHKFPNRHLTNCKTSDGKGGETVDAETQILQEILQEMDIQDVLREAVNNGILRVDEIAASEARTVIVTAFTRNLAR